MSIYKDISGKIETPIVETLGIIDDLASRLDMRFFIVGAGARDVFFSAIFNIKTARATQDVDLGIHVSSWDGVRELADLLEKEGNFTPTDESNSRFKSSQSIFVDIVPFGNIEQPQGKITWPWGDRVSMSTIGFHEAFQNSIVVRLRPRPPLDVAICTPPGIVMLKLVAWEEKYPQRANDAKDILFIMKKYLDAGNESRLYEEARSVLELVEFDHNKAGPRLLGRDIAKIGSTDTIRALESILEKETSVSSVRLITDMIRGSMDFDTEFAEKLNLLQQLKLGIADGKHRSP